MEQQKILWIIFSVALLFIVVIGAGFIWFFPSDTRIALERDVPGTETKDTTAADRDPGFDPIEWVRTSDEFPGLDDTGDKEEPGDFVIVYGEVEMDGEGETLKAGEKGTDVSPEPDVKTVSQPRVERREPAPATAAREEPVREAAKREEPEPQPREVRITEYWIQAGSFTSKTRAEQVKEQLASKGVVTRITSREVDGKIRFRVRIGPYANQLEAAKFLDWIRAVNGFENSYVSQVYTTRVIN